jgi:hypothetical protein
LEVEGCAISSEGAKGEEDCGISDDGIEEAMGGVAFLFLGVLSFEGEGGKSI